MAKLFVWLFFIPSLLFGQTKIVFENTELIYTLIDKIDDIQSIDGLTWVAIPMEQTVSKDAKVEIVDGYPATYRIDKDGNTQLVGPRTKVYVFDFKVKAHGEGEEANDGLVYGRPHDIKKKLDKKLKNEKDKKRQAGNQAGGIR